MNLAYSFATYIQDELSLATIGQDLFIGQIPSSNKAPDEVWSVTASGGDKVTKLSTGESVKQYIVEVRYLSRDYESVYENMQSIEESINADLCTQLTGYDTLDLEATTFPIDDDLESEDRKIGLLQITITTYKEV